MGFDRSMGSWQTHAPFSLDNGKTALVKADLGTKRVCPSCAARFYDLQKRPIECPKCAFAFEPELLLKQRRTRLPEPPVKVAEAVAEDEETEETEDEETAENTAGMETEESESAEADEVPLTEAEPEDTGDDEGGPVTSDDVVESEEDFEEELEDEDEEDDNLLEEVEEDEDDVSGIIDADIEKDEP